MFFCSIDGFTRFFAALRFAQNDKSLWFLGGEGEGGSAAFPFSPSPPFNLMTVILSAAKNLVNASMH
jgi:hypothetical protein